LALLLGAGPGRCAWQTLTTQHGLADVSVRAIVEARSGAFWFGTRFGLTWSNGVAWSTYRQLPGLPLLDVRAALAARDGSLWFATSSGLARYDGAAWTVFGAPSALQSDDALCLFQDRADRIWVGTGSGAGCSTDNGSTWTWVQAGQRVSAIAEDDQAMWFGTEDNGVLRFDGTSWTPLGRPLPSQLVQSLLVSRSGDLWVGTEFGVAHGTVAAWQIDGRAGSLSLRNVRALREDGRGNVWLATEAGLARFDGRVWRTYTTADGLASGAVRSLLFDRAGNLWAGADLGLSRYDRVSWLPLVETSLQTYGARSILEDSSGNLWFAAFGRGAARYDRQSFTWYGGGNGFASVKATDLVEDRSGAVWVGTYGGAARFQKSDSTWRVFTVADGLVGDTVQVVHVDRAGRLWVGTNRGACRYDTTSWTPFTTGQGLPDDNVNDIISDPQNRIWFATDAGVSLYDETAAQPWTYYNTGNSGLPHDRVFSLLMDRRGRLWVATHYGLSLFDGATWQTFTAANSGLPSDVIRTLLEDDQGILWVGTESGVSRYDGERWHTYVGELPSRTLGASIEERSGDLWFGTSAGVVRHEPDRVAPHAVIWPPPPAVSANRVQTFTFSSAFQEDSVEFSTSLDQADWSPWSNEGFTLARSLADGEHVLRVRARDELGLADTTPAENLFSVDATPPAPRLVSPTFGEAVRDSIGIRGTADDPRFLSYRVSVRPEGSTSWDSTVATTLGAGVQPVVDGSLAGWNTTAFEDGNYELQVTVSDTLGLSGSTIIAVIVDNRPPWARQTSPARVSAMSGGDVYTTRAEMHLYFPPRGFAEDAVVTIVPAAVSDVPDSLPGARRVLAGYQIGWGDVTLAKPATMEMVLAGSSEPVPARCALYTLGADQTWRRLGGSVDPAAKSISAPISGPGLYAVFSETGAVSGAATISSITFTPRVFSPRGTYAASSVAIGFSLGRAGAVTVKVYNRAGRLVRAVAAGLALGAGANVLRWDGRDEDGREVEDGPYLVTIGALGQTETRVLAVVR